MTKTILMIGFVVCVIVVLMVACLTATSQSGAENASPTVNIRVLTAALKRIDDSDHGRYSLEKHREWEASFERLRGLPDATVTRMIEQLKDPNEYVRACAAAVMGMAEDERSVDALVAALSDRKPTVRACAALALGWIGERPVARKHADTICGPRRPDPWVIVVVWWSEEP